MHLPPGSRFKLLEKLRLSTPTQRAVPFALLGLVLLLSGCGNTIYSIRINAASSKLEEARELGAERLAPYEYYIAREHLEKAQTEASEADFGDAIDLASVAEEYADKAIVFARQAHQGAGR